MVYNKILIQRRAKKNRMNVAEGFTLIHIIGGVLSSFACTTKVIIYIIIFYIDIDSVRRERDRGPHNSEPIFYELFFSYDAKTITTSDPFRNRKEKTNKNP
jgi:hypothetical protein